MRSARACGRMPFLPLLCFPGSTNSITLGDGRLAILSLREPAYIAKIEHEIYLIQDT